VYLSLVKKGDVVLEVGANTGCFTVLFSHLAGRKGRVLAFEPVPNTRSMLAKNVAEAALENVEIFPFALGDTDGDSLMYVPGIIHGQASLRRHENEGWGADQDVETVSVLCRQLDALDDVITLSRLDFVKIDAEGSELAVLRGARQILRSQQPLLHLEIEPAWMDAFHYRLEDLAGVLKELGYTRFYSYGRSLVPVRSLDELAKAGNVICVCVENKRLASRVLQAVPN